MNGSFLNGGINYGCPVNWASPLNNGKLSWWLCLPNWMGGFTFHDLCRRYNGTLTGMDPTNDWVPTSRLGGFGALDFDGTDDHIPISGFSFGSTVAFSLSWWAKYDTTSSYTTGPDGHRAGKFTDTSILVETPSGALFWTVPSLGTTLWHHALVTRNTSNSTRVFIDGVESSTGAQTMGGTWTPTYLGRRSASYSDFQLDDVCIWNRALSLEECQQVYRDSLLRYPSTLNRIRRPLAFDTTGGGGGGLSIPIAMYHYQHHLAV